MTSGSVADSQLRVTPRHSHRPTRSGTRHGKRVELWSDHKTRLLDAAPHPNPLPASGERGTLGDPSRPLAAGKRAVDFVEDGEQVGDAVDDEVGAGAHQLAASGDSERVTIVIGERCEFRLREARRVA